MRAFVFQATIAAVQNQRVSLQLQSKKVAAWNSLIASVDFETFNLLSIVLYRFPKNYGTAIYNQMNLNKPGFTTSTRKWAN